MKKLFLCLSAIALNFSVNAQSNWTSGTSTTTTTTAVGIGKTTTLNYIPLSVVSDEALFGGSGIVSTFERLSSQAQSTAKLSIRVTDFNDGFGDIMFDAENNADIAFRTQGGAGGILVLKKNGYVGIGTATPGLHLDVIGSGRFSDGIFLDRSSQDAYLAFLRGGTNVGQVRGSGTTGFGLYSTTLSKHALYMENATGKIGVGTTTPSEMMHLSTTAAKGQMIIESAENQSVRFTRTGVNNWIAGRRGNDNAFAITNSYVFDGTTDMFVVNSLGNVGIGANTPDSKLHVKNGILHLERGKLNSDGITYGAPAVSFGQNPSNEFGEYAIEHIAGQGLNFWTPWSATSGLQNYILFLSKSGCVGIGTDLASNTYNGVSNYYKLSVSGSVRAKEVVVETGWADYVFAKDYKLKSLKEVEQYINENGTLPNIPSEKEMKEKQIGLGEQNRMQQEKIEELTLYSIQQQKQIDTLLERLNKVESTIGSK